MRLVPLNNGVAFVSDADAPAVLSALARPAAEVLRLVAPREDAAFLVPGSDGTLALADAQRLLDITAAFALTLTNWDSFTKLEIWTSATTPLREELAELVKNHPDLGHLTLTIR